ncbi:MAG: tyrosine-type recombinase/integrase [Desulfomonilaceae bacterium]
MGQKVPPGLIKRGGIWHIQKTIAGQRLRESCGTGNLQEAEKYLAHRMEEIRQAEIYGVRPKRTFREAATKYLKEKEKATIDRDAGLLKSLDPFIGDLSLEAVHMGSLQAYIADRKGAGRKKKTINYALQIVGHILKLCAGEWMDHHGLTWLAHAPRIKLLREDDKREPYPMSREEQDRLFEKLPDHLKRMALFAVNTGCRDAEICGLRWEWEVPVRELQTSVFLIPPHLVKNRQDRLVVLNSVARAVIEEVRGIDRTYVFTYQGRPMTTMRSSGWRKAREQAGLPFVRVHDLKHTFGRRLRASGVSFEDRQDLLGHKSKRITTHYSKPELTNLIQAAERVCAQGRHKSDTIVILRRERGLVCIK